ncbi:MAG: recombinase [Deltaproteobacteria bacterium HGW-Deltaproteobacteria-15]|nr:MAG: recombinase [Deltaproteobacteria bacterium HGW-Deltaproteobacteria-15]
MVAIGYIRVSTEDQAKEGVSLDSQRSKIQAYCHLKDLTLREIIEDAGISAKNLRRPGAQKVLKLARRKEIDAVVVYKLDRFFRSTTDALETTKEFEKWGVSFHSIEETLDTRSAMGRFFFTLTAALAEMERRLIGERTKAALSHKRSRNEKTGGEIPYGYDLTEGGILIKNDEEQKVIRLIRNLHAQELSLRRICADLERQGYRTKTGNPHWHPETISHIIKRK